MGDQISNYDGHNLGEDLSFSMFIDDKGLDKLEGSNIINKKPANFSLIQKRLIHSWVRDESVVECYGCHTRFTLFIRKHHCRACGRVYCYTCCHDWAVLPESHDFFPKRPNTKMGIINYVQKKILYSNSELVRVCAGCNKKISELATLDKLIRVFELSFDVQELNNLMCVSKMYYKASVYCLSKFREIQYKLPSQSLSRSEIRTLWFNRKYFTGHNIWLTQLIISIDLTLDYNIIEIMKLLMCKKKTNCWNIMCTRRCDQKFSYLELAQILSQKNIPDKLLGFILNYVGDDVSIDLIINTLPLLRNQLLYEMESSPQYLNKYLIRLCELDNNFMMEFIIDLMVMRESALDTKLIKADQLFWMVINTLKRNKPDDYCFLESILNSIRKLRLIKDESLINIKQLIAKNFTGFNNFRLPISPEIEFATIELSEIEVKDSYQKPIIIPFITNDQNKKRIMCKQDDIRSDYIIQKIIKLMSYFIEQSLGFDPEVVTYQIVPLTNKFGLIEIVEKCDTIYNITQRGFTVQNYIMEHNPTYTVNQLRDKFIKSTASYSVITYLLGVGDRHLDNIMIHQNGSLFHIDYGYILGADPKLSDATIRISPHMLDAMGGIESDHYKMFREMCTSIYNTIRPHVSLISSLMFTLSEIDPKQYDKNKIQKEILRRFEPGVSQPDATCHLTNLMNRSHNYRWRYKLIDMVHTGIKKVSTVGYGMLGMID